MINKVITLSEEREVSLTLYIHENYEEYQTGVTKPMIVVCPGGGYSFLSQREAEPVAMKYYAAGFHAAVLRYGINEHAVFPGPVKDAAGCISFLKDKADEWCIDRDNIFITGFAIPTPISRYIFPSCFNKFGAFLAICSYAAVPLFFA